MTHFGQMQVSRRRSCSAVRIKFTQHTTKGGALNKSIQMACQPTPSAKSQMPPATCCQATAIALETNVKQKAYHYRTNDQESDPKRCSGCLPDSTSKHWQWCNKAHILSWRQVRVIPTKLLPSNLNARQRWKFSYKPDHSFSDQATTPQKKLNRRVPNQICQ